MTNDTVQIGCEHYRSALALFVKHWIAFGNCNFVHFQRATVLRGLHDFVGNYLAFEMNLVAQI